MTEATNLKIGDPWPFASCRGLTGDYLVKPVWHALITLSGREMRTSQQLTDARCETKYPVRTTTRHQHGKRYDRDVPVIPGVVYTRFTYAPNWDVLRDRKVIIGVFAIGSKPVELTQDQIDGVMGLPTEAERQAEALIPQVGEQAKLRDGPFSGFFVDVTRVEAGRVWYSMITDIGRVTGSSDASAMERIAKEG